MANHFLPGDLTRYEGSSGFWSRNMFNVPDPDEQWDGASHRSRIGPRQ
jgi:hypothetical protein